MGQSGFDFDGLLRMDMRMSFGGAAHTDELDDGFPGKRSLPRRDFDSDLDNTSRVRCPCARSTDPRPSVGSMVEAVVARACCPRGTASTTRARALYAAGADAERGARVPLAEQQRSRLSSASAGGLSRAHCAHRASVADQSKPDHIYP